MNRRAKNFTEDSASATRTTPLGEKELIRARITAWEKMDQEGSRKKGKREEGEMSGRRREKREGGGMGGRGGTQSLITVHCTESLSVPSPIHNGIHTTQTQLCISSHMAAIANSFTTEGGTAQ